MEYASRAGDDAETGRLGPLPLDGAPYRGRSRPLRDHAPEPPDQLGRLVLAEHATDSFGWHKFRGVPQFMALAQVRPLVHTIDSRLQPGTDESGRIQNDDAE
jgi:hypothetical protein